MKKYLVLLLILLISETLCAGTVIKYKGQYKLTDEISIDDFDAELVRHSYSSGNGTIKFKGKLTKMGFFGCEGLIQIKIPVEVADYNLFGCVNLKSVTIPNGIKNVPAWAFFGCEKLDGVILPPTIDSIGEASFSWCESLTAIEIPASVVFVAPDAFTNCKNLCSIKVSSSNPLYDSRNNCNAIIETLSNSLIIGCYNTKIPSNVTTIASSAFDGCTKLQSCHIPSNIVKIDDNPFTSCTNLKSLSVDPANEIYDSRENCDAIIEIATNKLIAGCKYTKIPSNISEIGDFAFKGCEDLRSIKIPNSVIKIGRGTFSYCENLTSIKLPSSISLIGARAFSECKNLSSISLPPYLSSIEYETFDGCIGLKKVKLPSRLNSIKKGAFMRCENLSEIDIPTSVTNIDSKAFALCKNLKSIRIPWGVTKLEEYTFQDCENLLSITLPSSIIEIEEHTFEGCSKSSLIIHVPSKELTRFKDMDALDEFKIIGDAEYDRETSRYGMSELSVIPGSALFHDENNNNRIDAGEKCGISFKISNNSPRAVMNSQVNVNYSGTSKGITCYNQNMTIIDPNSIKDIEIPIIADLNIEDGQVNFTIEIVSTNGLGPSPISLNINTKAFVRNKKESVDSEIPRNGNINENTFVIIIANENYQYEVSVPYAKNDGEVFRKYCHQTLGIPEKNIHILANATLNNIRREINWLRQVCEAYEGKASVILYYAGHGIPDEQSKSAYLLPIDGVGSDVTTGYKLDDLYTTLGNMPVNHITVFMDACFSGSKREEGMLASARGVALKVKSGVPQGNMVVFSAAQGDETAYPDKEQGHGMFTYYLLKKLQETKGDVSLHELGDYITTNVRQQSIVLNGKSQTPTISASTTLGDSWKNWKLR